MVLAPTGLRGVGEQHTVPTLAVCLQGVVRVRLAQGQVDLQADEALLRAFGLILQRHGTFRAAGRRDPARDDGAVRRVRDHLEAHYAAAPDLNELALVAGLSRHHLLRLFKRTTGLTPHAYLTDCRVRAARRLLGAGLAPVEVAQACGFFDQSHLNRAFKQRAGSAPGAYRAA